jgi:hypothetical protein
MVVDRSLLVRGCSASILPRAAEIQWVEILAIGQGAAQTRFAMAAPHVRQYDVVARRDLFDASAHLFHNTGSFVAEHDRHGDCVQLVPCDHIGMTHSGRDNPHQHFVGVRLF